MSRLIVVSERVAIPESSNKPAVSGLAVALQSALKHYNGLWFGWSGAVSAASSAPPQHSRAAGIDFVTIDLTTAEYAAYSNGFANCTLRPLCHYRTDLVVYERAWQQDYLQLNARFAGSLAPLLEPDDILWVHDYHLIYCAEELRRLGVKQRMGFFLHIPFPAVQVLLILPNHQALVRALFAYDLLGFQTEADLQAFKEYVIGEAGGWVEADGQLTAFGRTVRAQVFPIGLDTAEFARLATTATARNHWLRLKKSLIGGELVIGVDQLDYSKGLPQRLEAFERFLELSPEHHGRVSLLQIARPLGRDMPEYTSIREKLEATSGRINGRFAELDWVPIRYLNKALGRATLAGLYRASRLGLVTPYRDGMNLVAKEYVAAQNPQDPGCLVLSRFAGAAAQLEGALIVNPYDTEEVAEAIQQGMQLSREERCTRWQTMMASVRHFDALWWRDAFVEALKTCRTGREEPTASVFALKPELVYSARGYGRSSNAKPAGAQSRHRAKPVLSLFGK